MVAVSASCSCAVHLENSSIMSIWKEVRTFVVFYSASFVVIGILETCFQTLSQLLNCCVMVATDSWLISGLVLIPWDLKPFQQNANSPVISTQCHIANKTNVILTPEMVFSQYTHIFLVIMVMAMITIIIIIIIIIVIIIIIIIINFPHHLSVPLSFPSIIALSVHQDTEPLAKCRERRNRRSWIRWCNEIRWILNPMSLKGWSADSNSGSTTFQEGSHIPPNGKAGKPFKSEGWDMLVPRVNMMYMVIWSWLQRVSMVSNNSKFKATKHLRIFYPEKKHSPSALFELVLIVTTDQAKL